MSSVPPPLPPVPPSQPWPPPAYPPPRSGPGVLTVVIIIAVVGVAVVALLAAIAVPGFLRARKRSQATTIKNDLRLIDAALDQYAIEWNMKSGTVRFEQLKTYFKPDSRLAQTRADILGNAYPAEYRLPVEGRESLSPDLRVPAASKAALADLADDQFWSPYR